jgi:hypothetical protein
VIDGSEWIADTGFSDQIHLFTDGADVFTRRLAQQVAPLLRRSAAPQAHLNCPEGAKHESSGQRPGSANDKATEP